METIYKKGRKFLVFDNNCIVLKEIDTSTEDDKELYIRWTDGSDYFYKFIGDSKQVEIIPYDDPEWKGELFRKWQYIINGSQIEFQYFSKKYGMMSMKWIIPELVDYFSEYPDCLDENGDYFDPDPEGLAGLEGEFYSQCLALFKLEIIGFTLENPRQIIFERMIKIENNLIYFDSFADVLLYLYHECPPYHTKQNID